MTPKLESNALSPLLRQALDARCELLDERHEMAVRLFNGFVEGAPDLVVDLYGRTLLLQNYAQEPLQGAALVQEALTFYRAALPWLRAGMLKVRAAADEHERNGMLLFGDAPDRRIREYGVAYALDLSLNRDSSFYLDTRNLRSWARANLAGKRVLNSFAYTGSLGVAAMAGGAQQVVHLDRNRIFLTLAKSSYTLNGFPIVRTDFLTADFFVAVGRLKRQGTHFDCVFLDPPFFASSDKGRVDLLSGGQRLINKLRPLVADGGWLVSVNNALFYSGADYLAELEMLCADGYMAVETIIDVPPDCAGYPATRCGTLPTDPAPFNHATKIAVLRIRRKAPL
jgi:23S rRNA (cytosine1962-C5)-methyltransferase